MDLLHPLHLPPTGDISRKNKFLSGELELHEYYTQDAEEDSISKNRKYRSFQSLGLKENLLKGMIECGIEEPNWLQQHALKPMLDGKDMFIVAKGGKC